MELTGRIGEGLEELELPYGARAHEQELRHIYGNHGRTRHKI